MRWLIGSTGYSFFDYWTLAHFAFWFYVGSSIAAFKFNRALGFFLCLGVAFWWEVFEKFAEHKWPTVWLSPESWQNSWVSDLLTTGAVLLAYYGYDRWRPK